MASIDVGIHPDPDGIRTRHFPRGHADVPFSTLEIAIEHSSVTVFVADRPVLAALQAALDSIRADMKADAMAGADADPIEAAS